MRNPNSYNKDILSSMRFSILEGLCNVNKQIDELVELEGSKEVTIPKAEPAICHHVVALAGIIRKTAAQTITLQVGNVAIDIRRVA